MTARRPPRCDTCGRPVRPWHPYDGFGPAGFTRKTATAVWHTTCEPPRRTIYRPIPRQDEQ